MAALQLAIALRHKLQFCLHLFELLLQPHSFGIGRACRNGGNSCLRFAQLVRQLRARAPRAAGEAEMYAAAGVVRSAARMFSSRRAMAFSSAASSSIARALTAAASTLTPPTASAHQAKMTAKRTSPDSTSEMDHDLAASALSAMSAGTADSIASTTG